ncbi:MAG: hypothetical protein AMXMBFR47_35910 [Planctomycetota bacterium]
MARRNRTRRDAQAIVSPTETAEFAVTPFWEDRVRDRAYELFTERCRKGESGDALSDWTAAERQMKAIQDEIEQEASVGDEFGGTGI